ncbi:hypothetical protein K469DRAFT_310876 [Zopfia rhizophila CBS 207.26]|uniref:ABM domain-containing protein n=1 Tax=Zopfia rhizophila CBS 207.26 TaxID=1314779 RepID=A0A6A6EML1_9PEZI|nr:hypothetical protein K469DRAFT_310876 [Zopfia rhizophila CBS 207.26]
MPSIVVVGHLTAANKEARQTVVDAISKVAQFSKQNEEGVLRYAITHPRDTSDEKSVYVIEEYADQTALDSHMGSKAVTDLVAYFTANGSLFGGPPIVSTSETSSAFIRPEITKSNDPFIAYASIDYKEGTRAEALEGWKYVTSETQKNETDTLSYAILKDKENEITVSTVEVYANETYFRDVHAKSKTVTENRAKYGDQIRTAFRFALLKFVAGYLHKEKTGSNL